MNYLEFFFYHYFQNLQFNCGWISKFLLFGAVVCFVAASFSEIRRKSIRTTTLALLGWIGIILHIILLNIAFYPATLRDRLNFRYIHGADYYAMMLIAQAEGSLACISFAIMLTIPILLIRWRRNLRIHEGYFFGLTLSFLLLTLFGSEIFRYIIRAYIDLIPSIKAGALK